MIAESAADDDRPRQSRGTPQPMTRLNYGPRFSGLVFYGNGPGYWEGIGPLTVAPKTAQRSPSKSTRSTKGNSTTSKATNASSKGGPPGQAERVRIGSTVRVRDEAGEHTYSIRHEAEVVQGRIDPTSPMGLARRNQRAGVTVTFRTADAIRWVQILKIWNPSQPPHRQKPNRSAAAVKRGLTPAQRLGKVRAI